MRTQQYDPATFTIREVGVPVHSPRLELLYALHSYQPNAQVKTVKTGRPPTVECKRGHPRTEVNTYWKDTKRGRVRECKPCVRMRKRAKA